MPETASYDKWYYSQRDGTYLYGVHRPGSPRVRTMVTRTVDDRHFDALIDNYDCEAVSTPVDFYTEPPMGAYL